MSRTYDHHFLERLIDLCEEGQVFYSEMSEKVQSLALSSLFREMSRIRAFIATDLRVLQTEVKSSHNCFDAPVDSVKRIHDELSTASFYDSNDYYFIEPLESAEAQALEVFRTGVQTVSDSVLKEKLAIHLATMQLVHDRLKASKFDLERHVTRSTP
ncbi:hypothetical protein [Motiliproteus sp. MSK22-1]|uniref:hypothetical protein n=1 Tax=Motiliproteus sp. MSK22-1 TaxID=1897630 RepID=UPI000978AEFD|nr:hypothetical protein [Motiliproteus sp. MSK22-1]OMH36190.1 hypothetical protein BGP75_10135 [Motiliproteus sp. MSK22-1]